MFGHVRGAFTGADRESKGVFLSHDGGAVFLDEIGDLAAELQARLLRLLDNREVLQVGASDPRKVDVVVISATHRDLAAMVAKETFRADLLARLRASRIDLPPLRERREDILAIALATAAKRGIHYDTATIEPEAVERLLLHSWPANVRELARTMEQVASRRAPPTLTRWASDRVLGPMETKITLTTAAVDRALAAAHGNQSEAARKLGVDRPTLLRHLAKEKAVSSDRDRATCYGDGGSWRGPDGRSVDFGHVITPATRRPDQWLPDLRCRTQRRAFCASRGILIVVAFRDDSPLLIEDEVAAGLVLRPTCNRVSLVELYSRAIGSDHHACGLECRHLRSTLCVEVLDRVDDRGRAPRRLLVEAHRVRIQRPQAAPVSETLRILPRARRERGFLHRVVESPPRSR